MWRRHMHADLKVALFTPMEMSGAKSQTDNNCVAPFEKESPKGGYDRCYTQRFHDVAEPVEVVVDVLPVDVHYSFRACRVSKGQSQIGPDRTVRFFRCRALAAEHRLMVLGEAIGEIL